MDIKEILKSNNITQQEFADHADYSRQQLSVIINQDPENKTPIRKSLIHSLQVLLLEKRGISIDLAL